jgi:hypothetical protein
MMRAAVLTSFLVIGSSPLVAQHDHHGDSSFSAMKERGGTAMRVIQDSATHMFDALPDGGRIELQANTSDTAAINGIRQHFREIEAAFRRGEFNIPMFVHNEAVPGTAVMAAHRSDIIYRMRELPRGAELILQTRNAEALKAIHEFMAYQRGEHRAGGMH